MIATFFPGAFWAGIGSAPDWSKVVRQTLPMWGYGRRPVAKVERQTTETERRVLLGFSSGANFCLAAAQSFHPKLIITSGLSGWLPKGIGEHEPCEIHILHGVDDFFRSDSQIREVIETLRRKGHSVIEREFTGGHRWPAELNPAFRLLAEKVA